MGTLHMKQHEVQQLVDDIITGEQHNALVRTKIGIVGNTYASEILTANLHGLGIEDIVVFGKRQVPEIFPDHPTFFKRLLSSSKYYETEDSTLIPEFDRDIIVYATSDLEKATDAHDVPALTITQRKDTGIVSHGIRQSEDQHDSIHIGGVCAALAADEIRKMRAPLSEHDTIVPSITYAPAIKTDTKRVLAVGAGGIGNYFCMNASQLGHEITLVDHDIFETKNSHRQPYCIPGRPKANRLAEMLPKITPITEKFNKSLANELDTQEYIPDIVVGCVDNVATRKALFEYAQERNLPYLDGGVGYTRGQVHLYKESPEGTDKKERTFSCAHVVNPSVVIPNCIIGLHLATILPYAIQQENYSFHFDSMMQSRLRDANAEFSFNGTRRKNKTAV